VPSVRQQLCGCCLLAGIVVVAHVRYGGAAVASQVNPARWLASLHIHDEAYTQALAELLNIIINIPFPNNWAEGTTSSFDGQRFRASGRGEQSGQSQSALRKRARRDLLSTSQERRVPASAMG